MGGACVEAAHLAVMMLKFRCSQFTYLTDGQNDKIQTVIESGACRLIVACLQ